MAIEGIRSAPAAAAQPAPRVQARPAEAAASEEHSESTVEKVEEAGKGEKIDVKA